MPKNFVSYQDADVLITKIAQKFHAVDAAFVFKGTSAFASLPATPTAAMDGYVWDITDAFTTDSRFIEGSGVDYPAHTDVCVADLSTYAAAVPVSDPAAEGLYEINAAGKYVPTEDTSIEAGKTYYAKTEVIKYNVVGPFYDVDALSGRIDNVVADITDAEFDETQAYGIGDIVIHEDVLYRFTSAHTADDPWDPTEVTTVTILDLVEAAEPESLTQAQVNALIGLLD